MEELTVSEVESLEEGECVWVEQLGRGDTVHLLDDDVCVTDDFAESLSLGFHRPSSKMYSPSLQLLRSCIVVRLRIDEGAHDESLGTESDGKVLLGGDLGKVGL